ncbi:uncharacterized protein VP01_5404g1 [Puccinia sorghi]|uniref:Uncharacterized protein n=1 Tax=Puccinia sorghi TaxID=27349 RepID=A0A0L6ULV2_9BASI|nr:uncharacterized protein VP01_5404g1 [Puccinia sorghi]
MDSDPPSNKISHLEFLGTISSSWTQALHWKGHRTIDVFTWPDVKAAHVLEPLLLNTYLSQNINCETSAKNSNMVLIINSTLVASPTPASTLIINLMLIPHFTHLESGISSRLVIHGFRRKLLKPQKRIPGFMPMVIITRIYNLVLILGFIWQDMAPTLCHQRIGKDLKFPGPNHKFKGCVGKFCKYRQVECKCNIGGFPIINPGKLGAEIHKQLDLNLTKVVIITEKK